MFSRESLCWGHHMTLEDLGWNGFFSREFAPSLRKGYVPGRLTRETKINFGALLEGGEEIECVLGGKVWHAAETDAELPAVGDWVALDLGREGDEVVIRARLPRQSKFSRKVPGKSAEEQVIAANVDAVVVVTDVAGLQPKAHGALLHPDRALWSQARGTGQQVRSLPAGPVR